MQRIVVLGGGFAGLWSAVGAARALDELGVGADRVEIVLIDKTAWHSIRVRNYEADLEGTRVALDSVLGPIGVHRLEGEVTGIDIAQRTVAYTTGGSFRSVTYDRLVFALGSRLAHPPIPGLGTHAFDVDTHAAAERLNAHIAGLARRESSSSGQYTVLVVGGGLTGIEAAAEMPGKLRAAGVAAPHVILADHAPRIGSDMGEGALPVIDEALRALGIETRGGVSVAAVDPEGATLATGERIAAATVVWCAGMQAHPLAAQFPVERDRLGRLPVEPSLKIKGLAAEFAAGDAAWLLVDDVHCSVMSCQHGRPMGRFAGHNVVCDLLGRPMLPLRIDWYTTILDLGPWGAVYTEGWDRKLVSRGAAAKRTKELINRERIYPPRSGDRRAILEAAAPTVQAPPVRFG
ncbi:MAG: NAD(P)/FAD-dependent oxidoreductase [Reyranella sp.]|uniref:NAD(P)/FAD-dependent oxidoreductase n=1 Tax=Reyranella sp. TaxID=1929291 RepID=UPI001224F68C|nr:FAD-dependent oxidoreductase [Reyranella sp.]TAJ42385.1 MAG: NAD(P)/FAD-dependent oxidoreductase [Reyranella sp.]